MNELKPVGKIYLITDIPECEWYQPVTEGDLLYALPDTHRVVSVELLRMALRCVDGSPYAHESTYPMLRAIIDNKEQKE